MNLFRLIPLLLCDAYKLGHVFQYPNGTTKVYANLTPRTSRIPGVQKVVWFGLQYFLKEYLQTRFKADFFDRPEAEVIAEYEEICDSMLGPGAIPVEHVRQLHRIGYLPIQIKALAEGTKVPVKVPVLTITNTRPEAFWLPNFLETILSTTLWQATTSATLAYEYRKILDTAAIRTGGDLSFVGWQGHDFSMRGMSSLESAMLSGAGHLLSFYGTDTIPAIKFLQHYYGADPKTELIGGSVAATEHSVMCAGEKDGETETFRRLIEDVYPKGIVSIVSDTWDLWAVLTKILPELKEKILARDGKVVIRPDSGDPVDIICGRRIIDVDQLEALADSKLGHLLSEECYLRVDGKIYDFTINWEASDLLYLGYELNEEVRPEAAKGVIELLWDVFGGTVNEAGFKVLDGHIGAIYGDSITPDRARKICARLEAKGFASTNIVFGIGSFTYQYNTRDTFGFAMKATYVEVNGQGRAIYKDPVTDSGTKKSARGLLRVVWDRSTLQLKLEDEQTWAGEATGLLKTVFLDGMLYNEQTLEGIRRKLGSISADKFEAIELTEI